MFQSINRFIFAVFFFFSLFVVIFIVLYTPSVLLLLGSYRYPKVKVYTLTIIIYRRKGTFALINIIRMFYTFNFTREENDLVHLFNE